MTFRKYLRLTKQTQSAVLHWESPHHPLAKIPIELFELFQTYRLVCRKNGNEVCRPAAPSIKHERKCILKQGVDFPLNLFSHRGKVLLEHIQRKRIWLHVPNSILNLTELERNNPHHNEFKPTINLLYLGRPKRKHLTFSFLVSQSTERTRACSGCSLLIRLHKLVYKLPFWARLVLHLHVHV